MTTPALSIVVPLFNEEVVIEEMCERLTRVLDSASVDYEVVMVNDGSKDNSLALAEKICNSDKRIKRINFSRNFGHQIAISTGMEKAKGDAVVVIDADLQDPPEVILEMVNKWREGYDIVYGVRKKTPG